MKESLFHKVLKLGVDKMEIGLTLNRVIEELKGEHPKLIEFRYKRFFAIWFFSRFDVDNNYTPVKKLIADGDRKGLLKYSDNTVYINGEGYTEYIKYQELSFARESAMAAQKNAKIAIIISMILLVFSIIFSLIQILLRLAPISQFWDFIFHML